MSRWPKVPLREVLTLYQEPHVVDIERSYTNAGILNNGRGMFRKPDIAGSATSASVLYRIAKGDFIYSRLFAFEGAYTVVPDELDGCFVSNEFPTFKCDPTSLLPSFLRWYFKQPVVWAALSAGSKGMGNRRQRVHPDRIMEFAISLPPLDEQRRIVARLDAVAERIELTQQKYSSDAEQIWRLCRTIIRSAKERGGAIELAGDLMSRRPLDVTVEPELTYDFAGVYSFGRGVFPGDTKRGADFSYTQLTRLRDGDFVYPKLMAWEGALGVVPPECDGRVVSPEFPVFEIDRGRISPAIIDVFFRDPETWQALRNGSKGTNLRRRRINPDQFLMLKVPVPSKADRILLDVLIPKAKKATDLVAEASSELDLLLPSLLHQAFG